MLLFVLSSILAGQDNLVSPFAFVELFAILLLLANSGALSVIGQSEILVFHRFFDV